MIHAAFEHLAFNVQDMDAMADWYCSHLGLTKARHDPGAKVFLADSEGTVVFELYSNDKSPRLDFANVDPLTVHIAFVVEDALPVVRELNAAGATVVSEGSPDAAGDVLCMLRDPFGMPLQIVSRKVPLGSA